MAQALLNAVEQPPVGAVGALGDGHEAILVALVGQLPEHLTRLLGVLGVAMLVDPEVGGRVSILEP